MGKRVVESERERAREGVCVGGCLTLRERKRLRESGKRRAETGSEPSRRAG